MQLLDHSTLYVTLQGKKTFEFEKREVSERFLSFRLFLFFFSGRICGWSSTWVDAIVQRWVWILEDYL